MISGEISSWQSNRLILTVHILQVYNSTARQCSIEARRGVFDHYFANEQ